MLPSEVLLLLLLLSSYYKVLPGLLGFGGFWDLKASILTALWITGKRYFFHPGAYPAVVLTLTVFFMLFRSIEKTVISYFALCTLLFYVALKEVAKKERVPLNNLILGFFSPFFVIYALAEGTELLYLSAMLLALYTFPNPVSVVFIVLTALARYYSALFLEVLLFFKALKEKKLKEFFVYSFVAFLFTIIVIVAYSYTFLGDPLAQIIDYGKGNFVYRDSPLPILYRRENLLLMLLLLVFPQILFVELKKFAGEIKKWLPALFGFSILLLIPKSFTARYFFPFTFPLGISFAKSFRKRGRSLLAALIVLYSLLIPLLVGEGYIIGEDILNLPKNCLYLSDYWVEVAYNFKVFSLPLAWPYWDRMLPEFVKKGYGITLLGRRCGSLPRELEEMPARCIQIGPLSVILPQEGCREMQPFTVNSVEWRERGLKILNITE